MPENKDPDLRSPDFEEKVVGELDKIATSIVFCGKVVAVRIQFDGVQSFLNFCEETVSG